MAQVSTARKAARDIFLAYELGHDHFSAQLFRLFQKADATNHHKLSAAYPAMGDAYLEWKESEPKEFYELHDVYGTLEEPDRSLYECRFGTSSEAS